MTQIIDYLLIPAMPGVLAATLARTAMTQGACVRFEYDGKTRVVEPHAIGVSSKDGSLIMRGYMTNDETGRPWRLFTLSKIEAMFIADDLASRAPRAGYKQGDAQMKPVIVEIAA